MLRDTRIPDLRHGVPGPASEIEWDQDESISLFSFSATEVIRSSRPMPGDNLMVTSMGLIGPRQELPLWPRSYAGRELRRLYLDVGERALCEPGAAPWWDCADEMY